MSILSKAGPLGEKLSSTANRLQRSVEGSAGNLFEQLEEVQSIFSSIFGGGSGGLQFPLDVQGNPAYNAAVQFKVRKYGSPDGKSQKELENQISDNLKKQGATTAFADDAAASVSGQGLGSNPSLEDFGGPGETIQATETGGGTNIIEASSNLLKQATDSVTDNGLLKKGVSAIRGGMRFMDDDSQPRVIMYMPTSFSFVDGVQYENATLGAAGATAEAALQAGGDVAASAIAGITQGLTSFKDLISGNNKLGEQGSRLLIQRVNEMLKFGKGQVNNAVTLQTRTIVNPNVRSIFRGVNLREFTFQFKMIATSRQEADVIDKIITHFRKELYPDIINVPIREGGQQAGIGYVFPNAFDIQFHFGGIRNRRLPKLKECYLRNMSHTINPTGGGFRTDGQPNEVDLSLSFVEHQTLHKQDIVKGGF